MLKKQSNNIKLIALFIAIILIIIALVFGVSKFILKDQDENTPIQFNEYKVQEQEIVLSSEEYTGDSIIVTVTPSILPVVNSGKTGIDVMKLQYQITEPDAILSNNDNDWIDYIEPVEVDHNSTFNTRLVTRGHTDTSLEMDYTSPVTSREINNIAVAQLGNKTYKTLAEAITAWGDLTTEEKQTSTIQMLANTSENIIIPQTEEIKIDLCGFDIIEESSETPTIIVNGVLNIVDSGKTENNSTTYGKVTSTSNTAIKVTGANSELVLGTNESANGEDDEEVNKEGPVINGGTGSNGVLVEQGGNLEFYDGKITAPKTAQAGANTAIVVNNTPVGNENGNLITVPTGYRLDLSDDETAGREIATVVKKMMVSFDSNGGEPSNIADIEVGEGKAYGKYAEWPSDPTREGYTFKGWSTNLADVISENNYSIYNFDNRTTSEFRNDGEFLGLTNQPYIRIKGNESNSNIDTLWSISAKNEINVTAGKKYILSFYARSENSIRTQYIGMYSNSVSGKTSIGWSDGSITYLEEDINFDNDGEWHLITKEFIAPDNVSTGKIKIGNDIPNIYGTNSYIDIANIHFSEDESIVPYITQSTPVTQTQDHTLKAVWTPNTYNTRFVSGNLMDGYKLIRNDCSSFSESDNQYTLTTNTTTGGCYIPEGIFEDGKTYRLSYNIRKISGELINIAGHSTAATEKVYLVDGVEQEGNYQTPFWMENVNNLPDDENIHNVVFEFKYEPNKTNNTNKKIYIQPNRSITTSVTVELSDVQIYEIVEDSQKVYGTQLGTLQTPERTAYLFDGWYTQQTGGTEVTSSTNVPSQDTTYYAHWTPAVASTTINGTTSYYRTVQAAIGAIPADGTEQSEGTLGTVTLLYDGTREESVVVSEGQNVVLNTNGKTLGAENESSTITNSGKLTITGNGIITSTVVDKTTIDNKNKLEVTSGTMSSTNSIAITNSLTGTITISGGNITAKSNAIKNLGTSNDINDPAIRITGGSLTSTNGTGIYSSSTGTITIADTTITGGVLGIQNDGTETIIIYSGDIIANGGHGIRNQNGNITVYDGTITSVSNDGIWMVNGGGIQVLGGTIIGKTNGVVITKSDLTTTIRGGRIVATDGPGVNSNGILIIGNNEDENIANRTSPEIIGSTKGISFTGSIFKFYDGIVKTTSTTRITGTPTETPEGYQLINGEDEVIDGKTYHTAYLDNHYTVTYDYNGATSGNTVINKTVGYGENYGTLPQPEKTGYTFEGWNGKNLFNKDNVVNLALEIRESQQNLTVVQNDAYRGYYIPCNSGDVFSISRNEATNNRFRVVFTAEEPAEGVQVFGGTGMVENYDSSLKIENIVAPSNARYIFIYLSNQSDDLPSDIQLEKSSTATEYEPYLVTSSTPVTQAQNHTLKAIWTPKYTVTFDANGGTMNSTTPTTAYTQNYGTTITMNNPTRDGYQFMGWVSDQRQNVTTAGYWTYANSIDPLTGERLEIINDDDHRLNGYAGGTAYVADPTSPSGWYITSAGTGATVTTSTVNYTEEDPNPLCINATSFYRITRESYTDARFSYGPIKNMPFIERDVNKIYVIVARFPEGWILTHVANSGLGKQKWLTSNAGTGDWETYVAAVESSDNAAYQNSGFFYISNTNSNTNTVNPTLDVAYLQGYFTNKQSETANVNQFKVGAINETLTAKWQAVNQSVVINESDSNASYKVNASNLFDKTDMIITNSKIVSKSPAYTGASINQADDTHFISGLIRVIPGATYKITGATEDGLVEWFTTGKNASLYSLETQATTYTNDTNFTPPTTYTSYSNSSTQPVTYTYMRFHAKTSDINNIQLQMVDSPTYTGNKTFVFPNNASVDVISTPLAGYTTAITKTSGLGTFTTSTSGDIVTGSLANVAGAASTTNLAITNTPTVNPNNGTLNRTRGAVNSLMSTNMNNFEAEAIDTNNGTTESETVESNISSYNYEVIPQQENGTEHEVAATLADAIATASSGEIIKVINSVTEDETATNSAGKTITIDLNGKTITSTATNTINNQGILTIKGTGIIKNEIENGIVIYNTGSLNMEEGVVTTTENGGKAISNNGDGSNYQGSDTNNVEKSGTVNIKSGKIVTEGIGAIGLYNANNAKANISGGIFETRNYASKAIYNDSELEIENAKVVVSDYDSIGIYNGKNSKSCIIKETEIFIEAEEIENYDLIKNTDQFKEYIDKLKPSYGIYNDSDSEVIIETATIKAERLKSVGIMNNTKGTVTFGVDESKDGKEIELNNASPIVYAISDNTTAIINNKDGIINFYDGRVLSTSTIKNMIVNVLNNYEIYEELNSNVINTTLRLIVEEVESGSVDSNSEEISENESSEENENVDNESEDI